MSKGKYLVMSEDEKILIGECLQKKTMVQDTVSKEECLLGRLERKLCIGSVLERIISLKKCRRKGKKR